MPEKQFKKTEELKSPMEKEISEQKSSSLEMPKSLDQAKKNSGELQAKEAANVEIGEVKVGDAGVGKDINNAEAEEAEKYEELEKLKKEVRDFFREIILNSKDPERKEIEAALRRIANENEVKFDEIIDESYKLRDDIVKIIQKKEFDVAIVGKIENWLLLIFPSAKSKLFCKQAAVRLANEVKEHWKLK